ncbi:LysR family transcriptional regulator [Clostridium tertium]|uniref:HTH-type transcriptional regulator CysL n=1 Tax=Clostridium tertium TaxID=1559 RepID=A0A6N3E4R4_9CLOT
MNIEQLKTLYTVVEYDSFSKASEVLFCSQPAISKQIKSLEKSLGFSLFDRYGKKVVLNSNGKIVYEHTKKILDEFSEMERKLLEFNNPLSPLISFGATNFIGVHVVTPYISKFKENHPEVSISFTIDFIPNILKLLHLNKFSFAFISESNLLSEYPDIRTEFFRDDELILVVSPNHPWATKDSINIKDLNNETFLVSQPNSAIRKFIEIQLATNGVVLNNIYNLYNIEGIKQSIINGHGISILPKKAITSELKYKLLIEVPIEGLNLKRKLFFACKKNKHFSPIEKSFIQSLLLT